MNTEHLALLQQAPASTHDDDTWARLCCEQALLALEEGCYAVGALLVDGAGELLCSARNQVFTSTYSSAAHAEMQTIDPACPVILMSGYSEDEAVQRITTRGIARFLQKPFALKSLVDALAAVVEAR